MVKNDNDWPVVEQPFETEDDDLCPLCMEELDISDLNFRPCPCGYRICRFCWHHIKEDLNRRCPGCRKEYDDSVVEFKPMKPEELKRLQQAKKQREKERKDQELVNRKHLANVRVKQKNQVHVQGLTTKIANEDTLAQLKTSDLFAPYGRIQKMFMSRRTGSTTLYTPDPRYQHVNLYINFSRNNEALACIQGVDGITLPDGHRLKATLGSTKYCASFLRGIKCTNDNCTGAHELAEEVEGGGTAAREEMSTARHAQKESEHRFAPKTHHPHPSASNSAHPIPSGVALPATASWATKSASLSQPASPAPAHAHAVHVGASNGPATSRAFSKPPGIISTSKTAHPLPPKPPQNPSERVNSRITEPSSPLSGQLASIKITDTTTAGSNQEKLSSSDPQPRLSQQDQNSQQLDPTQSSSTVIPSGSGPSASTAISKPSSNILLSGTSHPPGLLPPGLTPHFSTIATTRLVPSLPPGLTLPRNSIVDSASISLPKSLDVGRPLDLKRSEISLLDPLSDDPSNVLSSFSPNFGDSRLSIFPSTEDGSFGTSKPFSPLGYSGTFNPFADTDFPFPSQLKDEDSLFGLQHDSSGPKDGSLNDRRGSRFGFARRDSSGSPLVSSGIASSPLRSIFLHQNGDSESPKSVLNHLPRFGRAATMTPPRPQDSVAHLVSNAPGDSTPDASVVFPGVNLAASYSANALPAAIARGVRSPGAGGAAGLQSMDPQIGTFQTFSAVHPRDPPGAQHSRVNERLAFVNRQAALSPTSFAHIHSNNHHEHLTSNVHAARERRMDLNSAGFNLSGQYPSASEMNSEFQDPAILNIRMSNNAGASNSGAYLGAMVQGGEGGSHAGINEIHPPFSMSTPGFNHLLSNRSTVGGYRVNTASNATNLGNTAENGLATQFGYQGVMHQQNVGNVGVHGLANSIGGGTIGAARLQQQQQPNGQNFYHHSTGAPGAVVGGAQGGLMGRW